MERGGQGEIALEYSRVELKSKVWEISLVLTEGKTVYCCQKIQDEGKREKQG